MSDGRIVVSPAQIQHMIDEINYFCDHMDSELHTVESTFHGLLGRFDGLTADAFQACQKNWHTNADHLKTTMHSLGTTLHNVMEKMLGADNKLSGQWG